MTIETSFIKLCIKFLKLSFGVCEHKKGKLASVWFLHVALFNMVVFERSAGIKRKRFRLFFILANLRSADP